MPLPLTANTEAPDGFDLDLTAIGLLGRARRAWLDLSIRGCAESHPWFALAAWLDLTGVSAVNWLPEAALRSFSCLDKIPGKTAAHLIEAYTKIPAKSWDRWRVLDDDTRRTLRIVFLDAVAASTVAA